MVDAVVSFAVERLGDFLIQTAVRRQRIKDDVEWLRNELRYMQSFLRDAEEKQNRDHRVQQWISEITDLSRETVDILEEININIRAGSGEASKCGIVDRVKRYACICNKESNLYVIGKKIELLRRRVLDLSRRRQSYGITSISDAGEGNGPINRTNMIRELRRTTSYAEEEYFVGFEDVTKMLLKELAKDEDRRSIISIYGMGGLGKTTLARKLYNSANIQNRFSCRAWVCVSQEYSIQDLLRTIIKSSKRGCSKEELEMIEKRNEADLERYLRQLLKEQRYLVVVDDVWHREAWESLKRAFPDCRNGSRVIITTRIKDVAQRVDDRSFVHHLRFLRPEESWDLFRKKISRGDGHAHRFSPAMLGMGKEMVGKCGGLPLAIVVLGGLLSHKKDPEEWRKVKEQLWQHMKNDSIEISHLLSLSYNDLPGALRQCFLYVGIFPEDYVISVEKLMWLWMAEEFIPQGNRMEDIAENYLHELINRSLIQVDRRFLGRIETCRIHDLLRDLVVEKAKEMNLFDIYDPRVYAGAPSRQRQAIHTQVEKFFSIGLSSAKLRSLVFFNPDSEHLDIAKLMTICGKFKHLYILDLENVSFGPFGYQRLPDAIGDLIHLKFLGLMNTKFSELPPAVGKLKRLQTLEISTCGDASIRFPLEISYLINLRHIHMQRSVGRLQVDTLTNLRTLKVIGYNQWSVIDTVNLVNLRELVVEFKLRGKAYSLDSISNLKSLTSLYLLSSIHLPMLEPLFFCPSLLRLYLQGPIEKLPPFNKLPQSLTVLKLTGSQLWKDPMRTFEKLLNLRSLELENAYYGREITCTNNGFQQLEYLCLSHLTNLENWRLAETTMPVIRRLKIIDCPNLKKVPDRLKPILHLAK